jgi:hypothetical protein
MPSQSREDKNPTLTLGEYRALNGPPTSAYPQLLAPREPEATRRLPSQLVQAAVEDVALELAVDKPPTRKLVRRPRKTSSEVPATPRRVLARVGGK